MPRRMFVLRDWVQYNRCWVAGAAVWLAGSATPRWPDLGDGDGLKTWSQAYREEPVHPPVVMAVVPESRYFWASTNRQLVQRSFADADRTDENGRASAGVTSGDGRDEIRGWNAAKIELHPTTTPVARFANLAKLQAGVAVPPKQFRGDDVVAAVFKPRQSNEN